MIRRSLAALLVLGLALSTTSVHADQLAWVDAKTAEKTLALIKPGMVLGYWVVGNKNARPEIVKVTSIWAEDVQSDYAKGFKQIYIEFDRLASGEITDQDKKTVKWHTAEPDGEMRAIDLAYVFIRTAKSLSKFESLAKAMKLECDISKTKFTLPKVLALKVKALEKRRVTETAQRAG